MTKALHALAVLALAVSLHGANRGDEVVVVFNKRLPESKAVAQHYADCRQVPAGQVFGLDLPTTEAMTRPAFRDQLQTPLARLLEEKKLWRIGPRTLPATNGQPAQVIRIPAESRIRYLLLCYGVPTLIQPDPDLKEEGADKVRPELRRNEAAVDSELALLPRLQQKLHLFGPLGNAFYTVTNATVMHPTNGLLMVTRLDGPTADIARGLVDKALQAETNGLWGRAYFDLRSISDPSYKMGDDWIRGAAEIARLWGFETIVDTNAGTFPASFPMDHIALYAGWYEGNACGPFAQATVEFMPGAIGYHLHSSSAATLRSTNNNWAGPLLAKGVTATMGCVTEPYLSGTPDIGVFFGRLMVYGFTFGEAAYAASSVLSWQTTVIGDPLYRPFGKDTRALSVDLERRQSPLVEWAYLKVVNGKLAQKAPMADAAAFLERADLTRKSAVLLEKLGDLYDALGKPSSSAWAYEHALKLDCSPQQRVRLMLGLAEKLVAAGRERETDELYEQFLKDFPTYPDKLGVQQKALALARKLNSPDVTKHQAEVQRLTEPPPATTSPTNAPK